MCRCYEPNVAAEIGIALSEKFCAFSYMHEWPFDDRTLLILADLDRDAAISSSTDDVVYNKGPFDLNRS